MSALQEHGRDVVLRGAAPLQFEAGQVGETGIVTDAFKRIANTVIKVVEDRATLNPTEQKLKNRKYLYEKQDRELCNEFILVNLILGRE